jgi:8-oxo-dGTP diphosphatase
MAARKPRGYDIRQFPPFAVTVDVVILTVTGGELHVLLVRRGGEPHAGDWALPGGFKKPDETLDEAARRELMEEAGIEAPRALVQFHTYGDPERDPRGNIVTVAYLAVTPDVGELAAGTDAADAQLLPVARVIDGQLPLAFDHQRIVDDAVRYASERLEVGDLATAFVGPTFTLTELKSVYEAVWGEPLDAANFRRSLATQTAEPYVEPTGRRSAPGPDGGRPPELFRTSGDWSKPPVKRPRKRSSSKPS